MCLERYRVAFESVGWELHVRFPYCQFLRLSGVHVCFGLFRAGMFWEDSIKVCFGHCCSCRCGCGGVVLKAESEVFRSILWGFCGFYGRVHCF